MESPIIHLQIGSLIEKFSIEVRPSTEKTREDLSRLLLDEYPKIQTQVLEALITALNTAVKSVETTVVVDGIQKNESHQSVSHPKS